MLSSRVFTTAGGAYPERNRGVRASRQATFAPSTTCRPCLTCPSLMFDSVPVLIKYQTPRSEMQAGLDGRGVPRPPQTFWPVPFASEATRSPQLLAGGYHFSSRGDARGKRAKPLAATATDPPRPPSPGGPIGGIDAIVLQTGTNAHTRAVASRVSSTRGSHIALQAPDLLTFGPPAAPRAGATHAQARWGVPTRTGGRGAPRSPG